MAGVRGPGPYVPPEEFPEVPSIGDLASFLATLQPLVDMSPPEERSDAQSAQTTLIAKTNLQLGATAKPENAEKRERLTGKLQKLATFAENHPFLTSGFVLAFFLAVSAAYFTVQALLGHTTLSIFHAHPVLGGGLTFMMVYHSVYLINMCRRASLKDDLEDRIEISNMQKIGEEEKNQAAEKTGLHAFTAQNKYQQQIKNLEKLQTEIQEQKDEIKLSLTQIGESQKKWQEMALSSMPASQRVLLARAVERTTVAIENEAFARDTFVEAPLPSLSGNGTITLPTQPTVKMVANQSHQQTMLEKMEAGFKALGPFIENNPGSVAMFVGGLSMCILSGVAIYFYFSGATSLYFFGSISLTTLAPMVIYGLSLIHEGYNNATINNLEKRLADIAQEKEDLATSAQQEKKQLENIDKQFEEATKQLNANLTHLQVRASVLEGIAHHCGEVVSFLQAAIDEGLPSPAPVLMQQGVGAEIAAAHPGRPSW